MPSSALMIRADANIAMGTGHVMRCLALAQRWQENDGSVVFAMAESTPAIDDCLRAESAQIVRLKCPPNSSEDARQVSQLAQDSHAAWVVVDGYHFDSEYQRNLKNAGLKVLFVDDCSQCEHYFADLVLDQNTHASDHTYANCESYTQFLTGPRFSMLRREFRRWSHWEREIPDIARRLLVTIGGSDPDGLTLRLIKALAKISRFDLEVTVVAGGSNPDLPELRRMLAALPGAPIHLVSNSNNMPELMSQSDLAVICAGGTLWELLLMGCPTLSYSRTPVQARIIAGLNTDGVVRSMGPVEDFEENAIVLAVKQLAASRDCREKMAARGKKLVDGGGVTRILQHLAPGDVA